MFLAILVGVAGVVEGFAVDRRGSVYRVSTQFSAPRKWDVRVGGTTLWRYNTVGGALVATTKSKNNKLLLLRRPMASSESGDGATATTTTTTTLEQQTNRAIEGLMAQHDPILLFASRLLPSDKATDASALYAWCRRLDEICDNEDNAGGNQKPVRDQLDIWQSRFEALWTTTAQDDDDDEEEESSYPEDDYLMDLALRDCIEKYQGNDSSSSSSNDNDTSLLTRIPFDDMIEGMKSDAVEGRRIRDMEELELYAYRVAGTVGLMLLPLLLSDKNGTNDKSSRESTSMLLAIEKAREPAICLGKAIQLVNILRDATQDAKLGRIYLPQDMLREEGVDDECILEVALNLNPSLSTPSSLILATPRGYKNVVKKVSRRALELLDSAENGKDTLPTPLGPLFVQIIVELYRDYLEELKSRDYDNLCSNVGEDRVKISTLRKVKASLRAITKVGREFIL